MRAARREIVHCGDPLRPARGTLLGAVLGGILWMILGAIILAILVYP